MRDLPDHPLPRLDDDGLLRLGPRWVAVPDAQLPVVSLLLERFGRVVPLDEVAAAYGRAGHSVAPGAVGSLLTRVRRTVRPVGLALRTVRARGVVLVALGAEP